MARCAAPSVRCVKQHPDALWRHLDAALITGTDALEERSGQGDQVILYYDARDGFGT